MLKHVIIMFKNNKLLNIFKNRFKINICLNNLKRENLLNKLSSLLIVVTSNLKNRFKIVLKSI
jgi:hypothetical protein